MDLSRFALMRRQEQQGRPGHEAPPHGEVVGTITDAAQLTQQRLPEKTIEQKARDNGL